MSTVNVGGCVRRCLVYYHVHIEIIYSIYEFHLCYKRCQIPIFGNRWSRDVGDQWDKGHWKFQRRVEGPWDMGPTLSTVHYSIHLESKPERCNQVCGRPVGFTSFVDVSISPGSRFHFTIPIPDLADQARTSSELTTSALIGYLTTSPIANSSRLFVLEANGLFGSEE